MGLLIVWKGELKNTKILDFNSAQFPSDKKVTWKYED